MHFEALLSGACGDALDYCSPGKRGVVLSVNVATDTRGYR